MNLFSSFTVRRPLLPALTLFAVGLTALSATPAMARTDSDDNKFEMVRSPGIVKANCLPNARGSVTIEPGESAEHMLVRVAGLPPDTDFDFFVIQVPNAPFGLSWYQGDVHTDAKGAGHGRFVGRFNSETFIVAPGAAAAPSVHNNAFPDATLNPATGPIHTYHLGLWFDSPADAGKAGCPSGVTPFNGEHNAGVQVLNTSNFPDSQGPLLKR